MLPYLEDMLTPHPEPVHEMSAHHEDILHGAGFGHRRHDTSFMLGAIGNMAGGKGGGMAGSALGGAAGAFGTYMLCKSMKGCTNKCMSAPPDCTGCLDMCAKMSAAGAAVGGAAGSYAGQKYAPGTGGAAAGAPGGAPGGMMGPLDEWNTAPVFALLQKAGTSRC